MSNVFTKSGTDPSNAGYFRVGFVTLDIPPQNISTNRVTNNEKIGTLRGMNEMFKKTGQSRWDATVTWTAMLGTGSMVERYKQWNDLQNIVAIFKAAPFVEVESPHLRQLFAARDTAASWDDRGVQPAATQRMAMALRQLRIDTHPDIVDALNITLTMTYFNYAPYSVFFDYSGDSGKGVSADQCDKFKEYISNWRANNMIHASNHYGDPIAPLWMIQEPGVLKLRWRTYMPVPTGQTPQFSGTVPAAPASTPGAMIGNKAVPSTVKPTKGKQGKTLSPDIAGIITQAAQHAKPVAIDPAIAMALCMHESGGNPNAQNSTSTAQGLFQLIAATRRSLGVTNGFDPAQSAMGGCNYLSQLYNKFGTYELALAAYYQGPGVIQDFQRGTNKSGKNPTKAITGGMPTDPVVQTYVSSVLSHAQSQFGFTNSVKTPVPSAPSVAVDPATGTASSSNPAVKTDSSTETAFEAYAQQLLDAGWSIDHRSDQGGVGICLFYKEQDLTLAPEGAVAEGVQPGLLPTQFSVLFVNNLAQIPLSAYQYPTYQHLGPSSSMVQVSFTSKGRRNTQGITEPVHDGLMTLTSMAHLLEQQYLKLRTQVRVPYTIHRMQAVYVENQVLNMLGVFGLMLDQVTTETVPESADLVVTQMTACQYENKFEDLEPYKMNGISQSYQKGLQDLVFNSNTIESASDDVKGPLQPLLTFKQNAKSGNEAALSAYLLTAAETSGSTIFSYMSGAPTFTVPSTVINTYGQDSSTVSAFMKSELVTNSKAAKYPTAQARMNWISQTGNTSWTIADYLMFKAAISDMGDYNAGIDQSLGNAISNRNQMAQDAYQRLFPYLAQSDTGLRTALNQVLNSPMASKVKQNVPTSDPSLLSNDHGAYKDMGLNTILLNGEDFNPGMYFVRDQTLYKEKATANLEKVLGDSRSAFSGANTDLNGNQPAANTIPLSATTSIPGNTQSVMQMCHIPGYSMAEAFPTFKLMFLEDANDGPYYAFDNFFSYAAVTDLEMIRSSDKPATLRFTMTNLSYLFNHKLYNDSTVGKWASKLDRFAYEVPAGAATPTGMNTKMMAGRGGIGGSPYQTVGPDMTEGPAGGDMKNRRVPLQYYPLQVGSKIQLRVGFSNNPDKLAPVFCGVVTEIEGDEILTITAQSFMVELFNQLTDKARTNGWFHLGAIVQAGANVATLGLWNLGDPGSHAGPAFGGITIFGDSGDVRTVISSLLQTSGAKHFGHWQIDANGNTLLKGFGWKEKLAVAAGSTAAAFGSTSALTVALQNNYDRTSENIMINEAFNYQGLQIDSKNAHQFMDQSAALSLGEMKYFIDSNTRMTTWELIRDVARRYPHFNLLEKWYGYPYSCDSTLVFGHPLDWYHARPPMLGGQEAERAANQNDSAYQKWWKNGGEQKFKDEVASGMASGSAYTDIASTGPSGLSDALQHFVYQDVMVSNKSLGGDAAAQGIAGLIASMDNAVNHLTRDYIFSKVFGSIADKMKNRQQIADSIMQSYQASLIGTSQLPSDALKPVRRYHFIDQQSIIHNGMVLNEKIYNAVKIGNGQPNGKSWVIAANGAIPAPELRILDVTDMLNDPKQNVVDQSFSKGMGLAQAYSQSFLKDEMGKMYRGEIILRGIPEIEPEDILLLNDPATATSGPVVVDTVIHIMNLEMGFVTIVKPRCLICVNEAASAAFSRILMQVIGYTIPEINRFGILPSSILSGSSVTGLAAAGYGTVVAANGVIAGTQAAGTLLSSGSVGLADAGAFSALVSGAAWEGATGTALISGPVGWTCLALCAAAVLGAAVWTLNNNTAGQNPILISPCMKFGRIWAGGINGWSITDLYGLVNQEVQQFLNDEIYPLYDLWMQAHGYQDPIPPVYQPAAAALAQTTS